MPEIEGQAQGIGPGSRKASPSAAIPCGARKGAASGTWLESSPCTTSALPFSALELEARQQRPSINEPDKDKIAAAFRLESGLDLAAGAKFPGKARIGIDRQDRLFDARSLKS